MSQTILDTLIDKHGYRKNWIAEKAGVSDLHLYSICSGNRKLTTELAERIASAMQLDKTERAMLIASSAADGRIRNGKGRKRTPKPIEPVTLYEVFTGDKPPANEDEPIID